MVSNSAVYVVSAVRTPIGSFLGSLASLTAPELGAVAIRGALDRAAVPTAAVDEVFMGNVLSAGVGQAPARQATIFAGLEKRVPATTVSKVCGSGMQALIFGARAILLGEAELVVSGGMESMSNVPYYLQKARSGYRMGDGKLVDGMILDGLWDVYNDFHMGQAAELCVQKFGISRHDQDRYAKSSYERALSAIENGEFENEIVPVSITEKRGAVKRVTQDEEPARGDPARFAELKPVFTKDGTITAANSSSISDGAAALVLASERAIEKYELKPLARLVGWGGVAQEPEWFTTAPTAAIHRTLTKLGLEQSSVELWEINEAFSCVALACAQIAGLPGDRVNIRGGAVALGHPIGASGARIVTTLLHALLAKGYRRGACSVCIGGGEALAVVLESV